MKFKKIIRWIHLVLGLLSGLIVLFLAITGCILAFEIEIRNVSEPYRFIKERNQEYLPPTTLKAIAEKNLISKNAISIEYPGKGRSAIASYYDADHYEIVFLDPYTGQTLKHRNMKRDFFRVVVDGHFYLWLPHHIGQPIAATATLIFLIMMITGLILWWPKNKAARKQRFSIKWNARWRRKNYDLHNVFGFYMTWIAIFLATTGLVMGFQWFARIFYRITNGGSGTVQATPVVSDTTQASHASITDLVWKQHQSMVSDNESLTVYFPWSFSAPVELVVNHRPGTYYNSDFHYYDQYNGKELKANGSYAGSFSKAKLADKILRMNYDVHVGAILGWPGKLLAFIASLIAASLPVTGFLIWRGKQKKASSSAVNLKSCARG